MTVAEGEKAAQPACKTRSRDEDLPEALHALRGRHVVTEIVLAGNDVALFRAVSTHANRIMIGLANDQTLVTILRYNLNFILHATTRVVCFWI